jgi:hypothetical protein
MPIGVLFEFRGVTKADYEKVVDRLTKGKGLKRLSDWPAPGILFHVAGPTDNGWRVVDVWESEKAFADFGEKLRPVMQEVKFPETTPQFFPVHNLVRS